MPSQLRFVPFALVGVVLTVGCGTGVDVRPVSGVVTLNGQPLEGAKVRFSPAPQKNPEASKMLALGMTDAEGRYSMKVYDGPDGAVVGLNRVVITTAQSSDEESAGLTVPEKVPAEYNSKSSLTFEVPAGGTDSANFELVGHR